MKASDVMAQHISSVKPDSSVIVAAQLMLENRISGLPVIDSNRRPSSPAMVVVIEA